MYYATFDTRNFTFEALSDSEEGAKAIIKQGWRRHCNQTGADKKLLEEESIDVREIEIGYCYRDKEKIINR